MEIDFNFKECFSFKLIIEKNKSYAMKNIQFYISYVITGNVKTNLYHFIENT